MLAQQQRERTGHAYLLEAVGQHVAVLLVGAIANVGHLDGTLEAAAHTAIDTLGLAPAGLHHELAVALVAVKVLLALDLLLALHQRLHHLAALYAAYVKGISRSSSSGGGNAVEAKDVQQ